MLRRLYVGRLCVITIAPETAFSFFICFMELLRGRDPKSSKPDLVIVLDRWPHRTLGELYGNELSTRVVWRRGISGILHQTLFFQSKRLVSLERLDWRDLRRTFSHSSKPMSISTELFELSLATRHQIGCSSGKIVALAVHNFEYDEERSPYAGYAMTRKNQESVGTEFAPAIDYLRTMDVGVVLLGSPDTGRSHIPREIPRLADFGELGGPHEVALASQCHYFWTDAVGAAWLGTPFRKPWFITNQYSLRTEPSNWIMEHLALPIRFQSKDGRLMTIREELSSKPPLTFIGSGTPQKKSSKRTRKCWRGLTAHGSKALKRESFAKDTRGFSGISHSTFR